jgi:hypothetical protein
MARLTARFPLPFTQGAPVDAEGAELLALLAGRFPDARALEPLLRETARTGQPAPELHASAEAAPALVGVARAWVAWLDALEQRAPPRGDAWRPERLEHQFTLGAQRPAGDRLALVADGWDGEPLDWYDVDVDWSAAAPPPPSPAAPRSPPRVIAGVPAPLSYPGMPVPRWWQFEDASVNFAQVTAARDDLARLLVVEFATVYGNDWYLWPLRLPIGAVHRVSGCQVSTTFGETFSVGPAGGATAPDWRLFRPTERRRGAPPVAYDGLVLLPVLASALDSEPVEDVLFLRDELANLAWAVERVVEGADGRPLDRHERAAAIPGDLPSSAAPQPPAAGAPLQYRFATEVPIYWYPLVPAEDGSSTFERLILPRFDESGEKREGAPLGRVLRPGEPLRIWQEEVPREGAEVRRRRTLARGSAGALHVWSRREKRTGRGEGSSGLRFDDALPQGSGR